MSMNRLHCLVQLSAVSIFSNGRWLTGSYDIYMKVIFGSLFSDVVEKITFWFDWIPNKQVMEELISSKMSFESLVVYTNQRKKEHLGGKAQDVWSNKNICIAESKRYFYVNFATLPPPNIKVKYRVMNHHCFMIRPSFVSWKSYERIHITRLQEASGIFWEKKWLRFKVTDPVPWLPA